MSLKMKIYLIGLSPLLFFIILGSEVIYEKYSIYNNSDKLNHNLKINTEISKLIHQTQIERGKSSLYLGNSVKYDFLETQVNKTNIHLFKVRNEVKSLLLSQDYKDEFIKTIDKYIIIRKNIKDKKITAKEMIKNYSQQISYLISYNAHVLEFSKAGDVTGLIKTYQSLEGVKEYAGKLRATVTAIISVNKPVSDQLISKIQYLKNGVLIGLNSRSLDFKEHGLKLKNLFLRSIEWKNTLVMYEKVLKKKGEGNFGVSANHFLDTITKAINKLNKLILSQVDDVNESVLAHKSDSFLFMMTLLGLLASLSLGMLYLIFKVSKGLVFSLNSISSDITQGVLEVEKLVFSISNSGRELSHSSSEQASSMQETSATMNEIEAMTKRNTEDSVIEVMLLQKVMKVSVKVLNKWKIYRELWII